MVLKSIYHELSFRITEDFSRMRLDQALSFHPRILTRSQSTHLIRKGLVRLSEKKNQEKNKKIVEIKNREKGLKSLSLKPSKKTVLGEIYRVFLPLQRPLSLKAFAHPLELLMEDEDLMVLNKPSGLVTHPARKHEEETLVNVLIHHKKKLSVGLGNENRPGIVHRLDKETSGLLVIAKNNESHNYLSSQFKNKSVSRKYFALVYGKNLPPRGTLYSYIKRHPKNRKKFITYQFQHFVDSNREPKGGLFKGDWNQVARANHASYGKWAMTHYKKISESHFGVSLLECKLETGRTHQIRVHFAKAGFPILGDVLYGHPKFLNRVSSSQLKKAIQSLNRLGLHAFHLGFRHLRSHQWVDFHLDWPLNLLPLLRILGFKM